MRSIVQPGRPAPERIQWAEARGRAFSFMLEAGVPLLEAARRGFVREGFAGGVLNINGGALGPFAYVMPALSKTKENAAFYSDSFRPAGITRLRMGAMTVGQRDGAPFFHCHGLWTEADGSAGGGHILPEETVVAEPFEVDAFGLDGAVFTAEPDPETNFKLFGPIPSKAAAAAQTTSRAYALRLRPNQDFAGALEAFCRERAITPFATEMAVRSGAITSRADGRLEATLDVALVDYTGGLATGRLVRGDNPVLMTMELVLEVMSEGTG
jgi:predicted DNA-binding protein with PD1-like motif